MDLEESKRSSAHRRIESQDNPQILPNIISPKDNQLSQLGPIMQDEGGDDSQSQHSFEADRSRYQSEIDETLNIGGPYSVEEICR